MEEVDPNLAPSFVRLLIVLEFSLLKVPYLHGSSQILGCPGTLHLVLVGLSHPISRLIPFPPLCPNAAVASNSVPCWNPLGPRPALSRPQIELLVNPVPMLKNA